eukprot:6478747-Amphidinium_carterae.3
MREVLPLPVLHEEGRAARTLARGVRQRIGRRRAVDVRTNESIAAVNWLGGFSDHASVAALPTETQKQAQQFIRSRVEASPAALSPFDSEATARSLLGSGRPYDVGACNVAPLDLSLLSIPIRPELFR